MKATTYRDLVLWQKAHQLVLFVYRLSRGFPPDERFALVSQVRRSASSIAANIVEGHARHNTNVFLNHLSVARGSLEETKYHLLVARDLGYLSGSEYEKIDQLANEVGRLLHAFQQSLRAKN